MSMPGPGPASRKCPRNTSVALRPESTFLSFVDEFDDAVTRARAEEG